MKIGLVKIHGISKENSLYFPSGVDMENIFNTYGSIFNSTAYYPPHYKNTIKLSTTDFNFKSNVNYVMLQYDSKNYYYFINRVSYISEDVIAIDIEMDTIQTFYNDIEINTAQFDRRFIERWEYVSSRYLINRNYIRENYSDGTFIPVDIKQYERTCDFSSRANDKTLGLLVAVSASNNFNDRQSNISIIDDAQYIESANTSIRQLFIAPIAATGQMNGVTVETYVDDYEDAGWTSPLGHGAINPLALINDYSENPKTLFIYYVPYNCISNIYSTYDSGYYIHGNRETSDPSSLYIATRSAGAHYDGSYFMSAGQSWQVLGVKWLYDDMSADFARNTAIGIAFDSRFVPAMFDENYYRIGFGQDTLNFLRCYECISPKWYNMYCFDIESGSMITKIVPQDNIVTPVTSYYTLSEPVEYSPTYDNVSGNKKPPYYNLNTDPWVQYMAYNKGAITMASVDMVRNVATAFVAPAMSANVMEAGLMSEAYDIKNRQRHKNPYNKKNAPTTLMFSANQEEMEFNQRNYPFNANYGNIKQTVASAINAIGAPTVSASTGNALMDYISSTYVCQEKRYKCNDYEKIAFYYHMYGYKVNDYIASPITMTNLFTAYDTRYYYNYYKFSYADIHLNNVIEDEDTCNKIADRFSDGVRFWRVRVTTLGALVLPTIGDYQYDNVEESYVG